MTWRPVPKPKKREPKHKWQAAYWEACKATSSTNKYGAKKTTHAGLSFASQLEADVYDLLVWFVSKKKLRALRCQPHVFLTDARIEMIPDFSAFDLSLGELVYYEAKGFETATWRLKKKLWRVYGPGRLRIYMTDRGELKMVEEIIPKR